MRKLQKIEKWAQLSWTFGYRLGFYQFVSNYHEKYVQKSPKKLPFTVIIHQKPPLVVATHLKTELYAFLDYICIWNQQPNNF